jgi:deazaflavin-dependent oxidoreductase (nitroreductase family)
MAPFERLANEDFCYLTTIGRKTGKPHTIEIWFARENDNLYLLSGGGDAADWVRNLRKTPSVRVRIGSRTVAANARAVTAPAEDALARRLLDEKYMGWKTGKPLSSWARNALPVKIEL